MIKRLISKAKLWIGIVAEIRRHPDAKVWWHRKKRYYHVGDIAPDSLLNRRPDENIGGFITVDPETNRITQIWVP